MLLTSKFYCTSMATLPSPPLISPPTPKHPQSDDPLRPRNEPPRPQSFSLAGNGFSDSVSVVRTLKSCTASRAPRLGASVHAATLKSGLTSNVVVSNALLDTYAKCGHIGDAAQLFDEMPERTVVSWTSMMSGFSLNRDVNRAISTFAAMLGDVCPNEFTLAVLLRACAQKGDPKLVQVTHGYVVKYGFVSDSFLHSSLIDAYSKSGTGIAAEKLNDKSSCRDVVSWTSLISGSVLNGRSLEALRFFFMMQEDGVVPNEVTILSVLRACSLVNKVQTFRWVHGLVMKMGFCSNDLVVNSLVEMFLTNGYFHEGARMFCGFCFTGEASFLNPETMATLLQGCVQSGYVKLGAQLHCYLIKTSYVPCTVVANSLIHMYTEQEQTDSAYNIFHQMPIKDIVSWNSMISCLVKKGRSDEAFTLLRNILGEREVVPDFITMLGLIQGCSDLSSSRAGQVLHGYMSKTGLVCDNFVQNALIDMYGKLGMLNLAERTFEEMQSKDISSWNSLVAAYGANGDGASALGVFKEMKKLGPNAITFTNILSACAHSGMVEEGFEIFKCMRREYGVEPGMEHFACMVDLMGRSGRVEEAEAFVKKMDVVPGRDVWGALLGACGKFGRVDIAERAARKLMEIEPESEIWRVALANAYASSGRWEEAAEVREEMRKWGGARKEGGWSSVEVKGDSFRFMVCDTNHPESEIIYSVLHGMMDHIANEARSTYKLELEQYGIQMSTTK